MHKTIKFLFGVGLIFWFGYVYYSYFVRVVSDSVSLIDHPARQMESWQHGLSYDLPNRVVVMPGLFHDFLTHDNIKQKISAVPQIVQEDDPGFREAKASIVAVVEGLPEPLRKFLDKYLLAIVPMRGLGSSAYMVDLLDKGNPVGGVIAIDLGWVNQSANKWFTAKEQSPFDFDAEEYLTAEMYSDNDKSNRSPIEFLLLHEIGHVVGSMLKVHPSIGASDLTWEVGDYPFLDFSWRSEDGLVVQKQTVLAGEKIAYYDNGTRRDSDEMKVVYADLARTCFPSLYGATNIYDDFAESFVTYLHVVQNSKPWSIRIYSEGNLAFHHTSNWLRQECEAKRNYVDRLVKGLGSSVGSQEVP